MNRAQGFSLIELVVVMVIAGILAAVAIPRFTDVESRAAWYREQVKAGVRYAQRQAVAHRRCVFVSVTAARVDLFYDNGLCALSATPLRVITTGNPYQLPAPAGVVLSPVGNFSFNGLGRPSFAADLTINVGGGPVIVAAETGYVQ
jgi:MSHA pilin protein MshC